MDLINRRRHIVNCAAIAAIRRLPSRSPFVVRLHCRLFSYSVLARKENLWIS